MSLLRRIAEDVEEEVKQPVPVCPFEERQLPSDKVLYASAPRDLIALYVLNERYGALKETEVGKAELSRGKAKAQHEKEAREYQAMAGLTLQAYRLAIWAEFGLTNSVEIIICENWKVVARPLPTEH